MNRSDDLQIPGHDLGCLGKPPLTCIGTYFDTPLLLLKTAHRPGELREAQQLWWVCYGLVHVKRTCSRLNSICIQMITNVSRILPAPTLAHVSRQWSRAV